ncbi:MAG: GntR family transcriptional regulator [Pseudomonadota bacterium]
MDDRGSLPKHMQISELLMREVASGRLADGARLPPEREMATDLQISVGTLRRALDNLTERGLLERVQGSGNYVRARGDVRSIYAFFRLDVPGGGGLPTAHVLSAEAVARPEGLETEGGQGEVLRIRRLRLLDDKPAALEEIWLDTPGAAELGPGDLSESLYLTFQRELGIAIDRTEDRVSVGEVPDWGRGQLDLVPGAACGYVRRLGWAGTRGVVEASQTWFDSKRAEFVSRNR